MALFTAHSGKTLEQSHEFTKSFGGAESNFAIALARLGHSASWISRLGEDDFGHYIHKAIRAENVDTSFTQHILAERTGIYFKSLGGASHPSLVIRYYRQLSAFSNMQASDISQPFIHYLCRHEYFFVTGISLCLSESCFATIKKALQVFKTNNAKGKVVFDLNIRPKLWQGEASQAKYKEILKFADIILSGLDEAAYFGIFEKAAAIQFFREFQAKFIIIKLAANGAICYSTENNEEIHSPAFPVAKISDPVGAGDAFAAGFVSGLLEKSSVSASLRKANALANFVIQSYGDFAGLPDKNTLQAFLKNN